MSDLRKAAEIALEDICVAKLCDVNSMSSRAEMLRLMDKAAESLFQALAKSGKECIYPDCETGIGCDGPCGEKPVDETAKCKHEPVAWHEPGAYGNVTTHKDWALANGWEPLYKEKKT